MRVAEHALLEQANVLAQLRIGVETAAGVVEIHVATAVKPRIVAGAKLVNQDRGGVAGMRSAKRDLGRLTRPELGPGGDHDADDALIGATPTSTSMPCRTLCRPASLRSSEPETVMRKACTSTRARCRQ